MRNPGIGATSTSTAIPPRVVSALAAVRWPALPGPDGARRLGMLYQLARTERWPAPALDDAQFHQIALLAAHAHDQVPFWRARLRQAGIRPGQPLTPASWARLPVLTRREVQAQGTRLYAASHPAGHGGIIDGVTSGSTGTPLQFRKTELHGFYWFGFNLRLPLWHGMDMAATQLVIRRLGSAMVPDHDAHWSPDWGQNFTPFATGRAAQMDIRLPLAAHLDWMLRERPAYVVIFPTHLVELARHCRAHGKRLDGLRGFITIGEAVPDALHDLCQEIFGVGLVDAYSAEEVGLMSMQCPEHRHHHVMSEGVKLEVLDDSDRPCPPGGRGRVVATPLHNFAMPLLRYEVGDLAEVGAPCPCGRGLPVLTRVLGRTRDRVRMPDGESRAAYFGRQQLYRIDAILQHQVAQVAVDTMEYRLVTTRPLTTAEEDLLREMLRDNLGYPFQVRFAYVVEIPREPSGKYKDFTNEISPLMP